MSIIKTYNSNKYIPIHIFDVCRIDGLTREEITQKFPTRKNGAYYLNKFKNHIELLGCSMRDYVEIWLGEKWPTCPVSGDPVGFSLNGKGLKFSNFKHGKINKKHCPAFAEACKKFSIERRGNGNPMYKETPWNKGNKDFARHMSRIRTGKKTSPATKKKQSESAKKRKIHGHTGIKHSELSKEKMRKATIKRWENGDFNFRKTQIEKRVENFLSKYGIKYKFQKEVGSFVVDFYCKELNLIIECQGDFFHCNPKSKYKYPKYPVQKRNVFRDSKKREYCKRYGYCLLELWESEINDGSYAKKILCELKK